jgi:hypothetical protein
MAERLTTNQEVPGSTPGWIVFFARVLFDFPFYIPITPFFHHLSVLPVGYSNHHILHFKIASSFVFTFYFVLWKFPLLFFWPVSVLTPSRSS